MRRWNFGLINVHINYASSFWVFVSWNLGFERGLMLPIVSSPTRGRFLRRCRLPILKKKT